MDSQAQKVPQFEMEYKRLMEVVAKLEDSASKIEARLENACVPASPPPIIASDKPEEIRAPIAQSVRVAANALNDIHGRIICVLGRLEI